MPDQTSLSAASNGGDQARADEFRGYLETVQPLLDKPERLEDIDPAQFDAVLIPGGHGPMQDLAVNPDVARVLAALLPDDSKTEEENQAGLDANAPWLVEDRLRTAGDIFTGGPAWLGTLREEHVKFPISYPS